MSETLNLSKLLSELANEIDITESQEGVIKRAYNSVADWLNQKDTIISKHQVQIFPQGSMMYGTTIKPINEEDDYDIDLVCEFTKSTYGLSPAYVKQSIGRRLMEHADYRNMLKKEEGRRCWTLQYNKNLNFHMDILPAIPFSKEYMIYDSFRNSYESMSNWKNKAMLATNKDKSTSNYSFIPTNPKGYAEWFKDKMQVNKGMVINDSIERVPEYPRKTVLQKSIQLLKRHRDVMFADMDGELKPISVIITTLVAKCYNGETQIYDFICKALNNLGKYIEGSSPEFVIKNPVMNSENFADKWKENPAKAKAFFDWKNKAINDFNNLSKIASYTDLDKAFKKMFAQKPVDRLMEKYSDKLQQERENSNATSGKLKTLAILEKISYRKSPPWNLPKGYSVRIRCRASYDKKNTFVNITSGTLLPKGVDLRFTPLHGINTPYKIKWQITNTGSEAQRANCLRGEEFEDGDIIYQGIKYDKEEKTAYTGTHYVQCFIIKNGNQCVGVSEPFVVRIQ